MMSNIKEEKERCCLTCRKRLLDEKLPICLRCRLRGRNYSGKGVEIVGGVVVAIVSCKAVIDNTKNKQ